MGTHRRRELALRLGLNVLFFASIVLFPWWVAAALSLVLLARYTAYEVIIGAVVLDVLYGAPIPHLEGFAFVFTAASLILFVLAFVLKKHLIFYS